ncbi:hypothetical protein BDV96DRAFT_571965 [Lophiotrema nucula]|uniref:Uncharacterized protein n=1 Tax=Lophiotrema nucula TaxID=690887 RepID=A0A6A5ZCX9_9PLEO|nr:hypothetical protein BDV96DRAFT_571965 [Lophiotrema nucula]
MTAQYSPPSSSSSSSRASSSGSASRRPSPSWRMTVIDRVSAFTALITVWGAAWICCPCRGSTAPGRAAGAAAILVASAARVLVVRACSSFMAGDKKQ